MMRTVLIVALLSFCAGLVVSKASADTMTVTPFSSLSAFPAASTVAALPACAANIQGSIRLVNNALLPALLVTVAGGGAVITPVFCNGSNWVVF